MILLFFVTGFHGIRHYMNGGLIIKTAITTLVFLVCIVLLIAVSTAAFVAAGYLLSFLLPVTLFQCSVLCIGATFVFAFILSAVTITKYLFGNQHDIGKSVYDDDEEEDFDEWEEKKRNDFLERNFTVVRSRKIGRNELCPCGSGKKYKNCCGK